MTYEPTKLETKAQRWLGASVGDTKLSTPASPGDTVIDVEEAFGLRPSTAVRIGAGTTEVANIASVSFDDNEVTLNAGVSEGLPKGTRVAHVPVVFEGQEAPRPEPPLVSIQEMNVQTMGMGWSSVDDTANDYGYNLKVYQEFRSTLSARFFGDTGLRLWRQVGALLEHTHITRLLFLEGLTVHPSREAPSVIDSSGGGQLRIFPAEYTISYRVITTVEAPEDVIEEVEVSGDLDDETLIHLVEQETP